MSHPLRIQADLPKRQLHIWACRGRRWQSCRYKFGYHLPSPFSSYLPGQALISPCWIVAASLLALPSVSPTQSTLQVAGKFTPLKHSSNHFSSDKKQPVVPTACVLQSVLLSTPFHLGAWTLVLLWYFSASLICPPRSLGSLPFTLISAHLHVPLWARSAYDSSLNLPAWLAQYLTHNYLSLGTVCWMKVPLFLLLNIPSQKLADLRYIPAKYIPAQLSRIFLNKIPLQAFVSQNFLSVKRWNVILARRFIWIKTFHPLEMKNKWWGSLQV